MNTILTDHELCMAMASADSYDPGNMCRAVEAAVVAKLAQQAPVAEIEVNAAPAGGVTATVWSVHLAPGTYSLHLHPAPQQADRQRQPEAPTDPIRVACISLDGITLTVPADQLNALGVGDEGDNDTYTLTFKTMTRAEYDALGEFDGF